MEKESDCASEAPIIEGALSATSFEDALLPEKQAALAAPLNDLSLPTSPSLIAGKLSLGADFFHALRPFLDLPTSSASPFSSEIPEELVSPDLRPSSDELLVPSKQPDSRFPLIDALAEPLVNSESLDVRREEHATAPVDRSDVEPRSGISNQAVSGAQTVKPSADVVVSGHSVLDETLGFSGAVENALQALSVTKLKTSSVTSVVSRDDGWCISVELIERKAVPDTNDLLGVYEVHLNKIGVVTRYERTRVRRRNDLTR